MPGVLEGAIEGVVAGSGTGIITRYRLMSGGGALNTPGSARHRGQPGPPLFSFSRGLPELGVIVGQLRVMGSGRWCSSPRSSDGQTILIVIIRSEIMALTCGFGWS